MQDYRVHNGWLIVSDDSYGDEDCIKIGFDAFAPGDWTRGKNGRPQFDFRKGQHVDVSPYSGTFDQCAALIDLGKINRKDWGLHAPISDKEIDNAWPEGQPRPSTFAL